MRNQFTKLLPNFEAKADSFVLDLGANRGDFSIMISKFTKQVWAFEPNEVAYKYLSNRTKRTRNIKCFRLAVGSKTGMVNYFNHPDSYNDPLGYSIRGSLIQKDSSFVSTNQKILCIDFEAILKDSPQISCLKIDIEGSESEIWPLIEKYHAKIDFLLLEIHDYLNPNLRRKVEGFIKEKNLTSKWSTEWL